MLISRRSAEGASCQGSQTGAINGGGRSSSTGPRDPTPTTAGDPAIIRF
jgi:hypothetical protein